MTATSAHPQQTTFSAIVAELRFWPAVAAIGLEVIGLGLWGLMALESRGGTCVVRTCDEAHIPSPAFLAAMIATSTAMLLTLVAVALAVPAALALTKARSREQVLVALGGLAAFGGQWAQAGIFQTGDGWMFPLKFPVALLYIAVLTLGPSPVPLAGIGYGGYQLLRHRRFRWWPATCLVGGIALISGFALAMLVGDRTI